MYLTDHTTVRLQDKSVSVSVRFEEKRTRVLALAHTLALFSAPQAGTELFFQYAYYQLFAEAIFKQVSNFTPLCLHLLYKVNYSF